MVGILGKRICSSHHNVPDYIPVRSQVVQFWARTANVCQMQRFERMGGMTDHPLAWKPAVGNIETNRRVNWTTLRSTGKHKPNRTVSQPCAFQTNLEVLPRTQH